MMAQGWERHFFPPDADGTGSASTNGMDATATTEPESVTVSATADSRDSVTDGADTADATVALTDAAPAATAAPPVALTLAASDDAGPMAAAPAAMIGMMTAAIAPLDGKPLPDTAGLTRLRLLREFRAEVQDLQTLLKRVGSGDAALADAASYIDQTRRVGETLLAAAETAAGETAADSDAIRHIRNAWEQMKISPLLASPPAADIPAQDQFHHLAILESLSQTIIFQIGALTIPERLNGWLERARPGYYIPFHKVFEDELPNADDRSKVLNFLAWSPNALQGGLVEGTTGLIYRYDQNKGRQALSLVWLIVALAAVTGLLVALSSLQAGIDVWKLHIRADDWPIAPGDLPAVITAWFAVLAGIVVHIAVDTAKRMQTEAALPPVIAATDWLPQINAKLGPILLKVLLALIGLVGLAFAAGVDQVTPLNAFLIGYGLDSVAGLFGSNLDQRAAAQAASLQKALSV